MDFVPSSSHRDLQRTLTVEELQQQEFLWKWWRLFITISIIISHINEPVRITGQMEHLHHPPYLSDLLQSHEPTRSLRSSSPHQFSVSCYNLTFGSRVFRFSTPRVWNSLPVSIHESQSLPTFRRHLKTFYFQSAYPLQLPTLPRISSSVHPDSSKTLALYKSFTYLLNWQTNTVRHITDTPTSALLLLSFFFSSTFFLCSSSSSCSYYRPKLYCICSACIIVTLALPYPHPPSHTTGEVIPCMLHYLGMTRHPWQIYTRLQRQCCQSKQAVNQSAFRI